MKVKIVQIATAASTDETWDTLLLDDKGRVWRETYNGKWIQLDLPEAPNE